ncbi:MAG: DNA internalization-related competence protein ComEC/Rec2 [Candidatus Poribacteria bacterium]|nr:DNA internalization-related competence protein ComEC/Rec2 [Candidatus Poribacteria bacterium]
MLERSNFQRRPMIPLAAAFAAGVLGGCYSIHSALALGAVAAAALGSWHARNWKIAAYALLAFIGWARWHAHVETPVRALEDRQSVQAEGYVVERAERAFSVDLTIVGQVLPSGERGRLLLRCPAELSAEFSAGAMVSASGELRQPTPMRNPNGFNQELFFNAKGIDSAVRIRNLSDIERIGVGGPFWMRAAYRIRQGLLARFSSALSPPNDALLAGILIGERRAIPEQILEAFRDGGVIHVLVVSGANFALVVSIAYVLLRAAGAPLRAVYAASLFLCWAFALLVGFHPSVARAGTLIALLMLGRLLNREADMMNLLAASALALLIYRPANMFDIGFQLSFAATFGIVFFLPKWNDALEPTRLRLLELPGGKLLWTWGVQTALVSSAAHIATMPIIGFHFQKVYLAGFAANLIVVAMIALITASGLVTAAAALLWTPLGRFYGGATELGFDLLLPIVRAFSELPYAVLNAPRTWAGYYFVCLFLLFSITYARYVQMRLREWTLLAGACILLLAQSQTADAPNGLLEATFLDVGQGDAAFIQLPDNTRILIDAGSASEFWDNGERVVVPYLLSRGIDRLDAALITHADIDHAGGIPYAIRNLRIDTVLGAPPGKSGLVEEAARERGSRVRYGAGETIAEGIARGMPFSVKTLYPRSEAEVDLEDSNHNADSFVVMLEYGDCRILMTGDIDAQTEAELTRRHHRGEIDLSADILKTPHHGSKSSSGEPFLRAVSPRAAVISAGRGNIYGHPHPSVLERHAALGVQTYRTDLSGAVRILTDGRRIWVKPTIRKP